MYSGDVTDANLATQINVLNNAYANAGVSPKLSCGVNLCMRPVTICSHVRGQRVKADGRDLQRPCRCVGLVHLRTEGLSVRHLPAHHLPARKQRPVRLVPSVQVTFLVASITRVNQPQFWNIDPNSDDLANFKTQNYKGTYADFNLFTTMLQNSVLGCGALQHRWSLCATIHGMATHVAAPSLKKRYASVRPRHTFTSVET